MPRPVCKQNTRSRRSSCISSQLNFQQNGEGSTIEIENKPSINGCPTAHNVRKSERLAEKNPKTYSYHDKWCEDCRSSYASGCSNHPVFPISDKIILARAFASLPDQLSISKIKDESPIVSKCGESSCIGSLRNTSGVWTLQDDLGGCAIERNDCDGSSICDIIEEVVVGNSPYPPTCESVYGVFARREVPTRTQFGPLVCKFIEESEPLKPQTLHLLLDLGHDKVRRADISDENVCNWMMFVRPASSAEDQNVVVFQHERSIFFATTRNIEVGEELKVWYAVPYAERLGIPVLEEKPKREPGYEDDSHGDEDDNNNDDDDDDDDDGKGGTGRYCRRCTTSFPTEMLLKEHSVIHDDVEVEGGSKERRRRREIKFEDGREDADDDYHPKKARKRSLPHNLRKHRKKKKITITRQKRKKYRL